MSKGKLKKEDQKALKVLSKVISVLAKICKVLCIIAIPCIILMMVFMPIMIKRVSVKNNDANIQLELKTSKKPVKIILADGKLDKEDKLALQKTSDLLEKNSTKKLIVATETIGVFIIALIVITILLLDHIYALFNSFYSDTTPFKEENVKHLKDIAILMIVSLVVQGIPAGIMEVVLKAEANSTFASYDLLTILMVFTMSYIFKYGVELQGKSKAYIYDEEIN